MADKSGKAVINPRSYQVSKALMTFNRFAKRGGKRWKPLQKSNKENAIETFLAVRDQRDVMDPLLCWEWAGLRNLGGYGIIRFEEQPTRKTGNRRDYLVHRISFEFCKGRINPGFLVMHSCDNRACYNPNHLFLGTHQDNMQDMARKGRQHLQRKKLELMESAYSAPEIRRFDD